MTLRSEIREAMRDGPKTAAMLAQLCESATDEKQIAQNLYALQNVGYIKNVGSVGNRANYAIADWPEKGEGKTSRSRKAAPPPKAKRAYKKRGKKAARARAAELAAEPAPIANGSDEFAITDAGQLTIKQNDTAILLQPTSFARLRTFIERTEPVYNPTE